jgi:hypothetical protein
VTRLLRLLGLIVFWCAVVTIATGQTCFTNSQVTLTGSLRGANGTPSSNSILTLTPSQAGFIQGCAIDIATPVTCATSTDGSVVGIPNPLTATIDTSGGSGSLPAGTYYTVYEWYDAAGHVTLASPETRISATSALVVNPPASGVPTNAVGMDVFIGTASGGETLQGQTSGSASYVQSAALVTGAAPSSTNTTLCQVVANDAIWPTGTGYKASMTDSSGNAVPGFPMQWQLLGPGSTINLANGLPYYHGVVTYPVPILAQPASHGLQSISGPLSLGAYELFAGSGHITGNLEVGSITVTGSAAPAVNCPTISTVAACIALLPTGGGTVMLGIGTYRSGLDQSNPAISTAHVDIEGSGMPWFNSPTAPTALVGGTIIQGTVAAIQGANFLTIRNLGIDVGPAFVNATYGGVPADVLSLSNSGQVIGAPQIESPIIENVVGLGYNLSAPYHVFLVENVDHAYVHNTSGVYNLHGSILKGTNSVWDGDYERGHSVDSFIVKSDPYAPSSSNILSHITLDSLAAPGDSNGMIISAQDQINQYLTLSDFTIGAMANFGILLDGGSTSLNNVTIVNGTIDYKTTGSSGSCMSLQNQTSRITVGNLICNNYYQGFGASSASGNDVVLTNSVFTNIAHEALVTQGRWTVTGTAFTNIGDHVFYNEASTLTAANNTYTSVVGTVFQGVGGNFAGVDAGQLGFPDAGFLTTHCGSTASTALDVQDTAGSLNLLRVDCTGNTTILGNTTVAGGGQTMYRCATAGALPVGALTVNAANCGTTTDTGIRVH